MKNKNMQWWKIALCALAVLMIAGAITYTLMTRTAASSSSPSASNPAQSLKAVDESPSAGNPDLSLTPVGESAPASNPAQSTAAASTPSSDGSGELNWVKNLSPKFETYDYIFIVFPGNDDATGKADQAVKTSLEKIKQNGGVVDTMTLSSTDPEFQVTMDRLAIQKLPAVLVFAATGKGTIVKGDITETKLLQAYLSLQKTCVPGSGCCGQ
jgi:hypothetical protein